MGAGADGTAPAGFVRPERIHPNELDHDFFETPTQTYLRRCLPPSGASPN